MAAHLALKQRYVSTLFGHSGNAYCNGPASLFSSQYCHVTCVVLIDTLLLVYGGFKGIPVDCPAEQFLCYYDLGYLTSAYKLLDFVLTPGDESMGILPIHVFLCGKGSFTYRLHRVHHTGQLAEGALEIFLPPKETTDLGKN